MKMGRLIPVFLVGFLMFFDQSLQAKIRSTDTVLLNRAQKFKELGLMTLAREQYQFILRKNPKLKGVENELKKLKAEESLLHYNNALFAQKTGALSLSLIELDRSLKAEPHNKKAQKLKKKIDNEMQLERGLKDRVSDDYLMGLNHYQNANYDRALESFVKVLNLDSRHKGALLYVEKIGHKLTVDRTGFGEERFQ